MKHKKLLLFIFLFTFFFLSVGYCSFATEFQLTGTAEIVGTFDVRIIDVSVEDMDEDCKVNTLCDTGEPEFTATSINFDAKLAKPGNWITYKVLIKNVGSIEAKLEKIYFDIETNTGSSALFYTVTSPKTILKMNESTSFIVKVEYDETVEELPLIKTKTITGYVKYVQN